MHNRLAAKFARRAVLLLSLSALGACANGVSPIDEAYNSGAANFSLAGGYTRTIFSTNNF